MSFVACRLEELAIQGHTLKIWLVAAGDTQQTKKCKLLIHVKQWNDLRDQML